MINTSEHTDQELFGRIQSGDKQAFHLIYEKYSAELFSDAFRRIKDYAACKDIVQEVFVDFWQRAGKITIDNIRGFLFTAVRYQVIKLMSRSAARPFYSVFDEMAALNPSAPEMLHYKDLLSLVELWIETLPPKRKEIFLLHYRENLGTREIADKLGLSQKSVQNQLGIAFKDLRGRLPELVLMVLFSHPF